MREHLHRGLFALLLGVLLCVVGSAYIPSMTEAAPPPVRAGGKGPSEASAVEDMKKAAFKKVLGQVTAWSDDPQSPYQQLLARYKEFVGTEKIDKHGNNGGNYFVLGKVPVHFDLLQTELAKLVTREQGKKADDRTVFILVRFLGASHEQSERQQERTILDRYNTQLKLSGFDVGDADEMLKRLPTYHGLNYEAFVAKVQEEVKNTPEVMVAIVGEILLNAMNEDTTGTTASCDINIKAFDCVNGFRLITNYEGSDVLHRKTREEAGKFLLEKAAISSAKAIADKLVVYWKGQK